MKIAIYGPMCSGKTTIASMIQEINPNYKVYSFGQRIKELAKELFHMEGKDRSLLINIADKMREIDEDVWAKLIHNRTKNETYCIIDDLRFQNELNYLQDWKIICLTTSLDERIKRIKNLYPNNFQDHINNMKHKSETDTLSLPEDTVYIDTAIPKEKLMNIVKVCLKIK
tara:strand:- start:2211 stop:2720 length:510 start_codon:yes stop_codon:yes gene_type:complete